MENLCQKIDESREAITISVMKKIVLLRHAKSSWKDVTLDDHDRPLNARGRSAAPAIGEWLRYRKHLPDTILCSSSARTRETVKGVAGAVPALPVPEYDPGLYHASPADMLHRLQALGPGTGTVMLVGHQPGLGSLVRLLSNGTESRRCARAFEHFPTAAAAVLEVDVEDWADLAYGTARFVDFAKPRELMDA